MTKILSITLALGLTACLDHSKGPLDPGGGIFRDGTVTSAWTGDGQLRDVTVAARDVGGDGTVVNSETYSAFDHGFKLDLPGGHYALELTDAAHHVIATYPDIVVDGDVTIGAPDAEK